jgi:hypothetical protein
MERLFREALFLIGAPLAVALVVLLGGTALAQAPSENEVPPLWPVSECHTATVAGVAGSGSSGSALLCTADDAVRPGVYLSGLVPGRAYSLWLLTAAEPGDPGAMGKLATATAGADGTAHIRGHVDGWSAAGDAAVTLVVTRQPDGAATPPNVETVVARSVVRLP